MAPTLADVVGVLEHLYPPILAADWDAVGLVCGDPGQRIDRVLFAVDPVESVVAEAQRIGANLLITHHPLYLRGTTSVAATSARGRIVHALISSGIALYVAHTNADHAAGGVSDALAKALGLADLHPLQPLPAPALDKIVTFVPAADAGKVLDALAGAGAGAIGAYSRCAWTVEGVGTFRPTAGANPTIGTVGEIARVDETRIEMVLDRARRFEVVAALRATHPYEEPAFDVVELASWPGDVGAGRVGRLASPVTLRAFAVQVGASLPATAGGGRMAGDSAAAVRTVAVCGGSGGEYLPLATRAGADVYVTADLRHHVVSDHLADGGCAVIDMAHWATEWPWLGDAAERLRAELARGGTTVDAEVSTACTDPWVERVDSAAGKDAR